MAELRVQSTGTIKLFESDDTSSVTIASPASLSSNRTVTLPDGDVTLVAGTMLTSGGLVLQVVTSANTTATTNSTTGFVDSGNSVAITPSTATNKVLIHFTIPVNIYRSSGTSARYGWKVLRGATIIASGVTVTNYGYVGSSVEKEMGFVWNYTVYDEPDSGSEQTYKVQFANNEAGNLVAQPSSNTGCITALEVEST
jgi:hypothetical protein